MLVKVFSNEQFIGLYRAMNDTGSHANLVKFNTFKHLNNDSKQVNIDLVGVTESTVRIKRQITVYIEPWFGNEQSCRIKTTLLVVPKTSKWMPIYPSQDVPCDVIDKPLEGPMADPLFWKSDVVPLLFGVELYALILDGSTQKVSSNLVSQQTLFGNMIMGRAGDTLCNDSSQILTQKSVYTIDLKQIDENLQKLWQFDELALCTTKNVEHEIIEQMFQETHYRDESGRHVVQLPIKPQISELGSSREIALKRFFMLEKRGQRDTEYWQQYVKFMREYEQLGHMVEATQPPVPGKMCYYIPHHGINSGKKFRVVFDASCPTDKGISLNDAQFVGPKLQRDLHDIIIRFRRHKIAINADIEKMYRQIRIVPEQWDLHRIFFRENPKEPLKEYCMVVITYGLASSPYLSVKCMIEGAEQYKTEFPEAVKIIQNDFYMDDCASGAENEEHAIKLAKEIDHVLKKSQFELRKWRSNSVHLVNNLAGEAEASVLFEEKGTTSLLGMKWLPKPDVFTYVVRANNIEKLTKRSILSITSQLFDPNGLIAPVVTKAKLLIQSLWKAKISWDEKVPIEITKQWESLWSTIHELSNVRIKRWIGYGGGAKVQLHGFADSSGKAYGGAIYVRIEHDNNSIETHLIAAKSRVAPIKEVSIPRLELSAAHVLCVLFDSVRKNMELEHVPYQLWTDNIAAIQWIRKELHELRLYVANRVKIIKQLSDPNKWNHVRSECNPADSISRGISPKEIVQNRLWWNGPEWLSLPQEQWPTPVNIERFSSTEEVLKEIKVMSITIERQLEIYVDNKGIVPLIDYTETLAKLCRILAYVQRFIINCRDKTRAKRDKPIQNWRIQKMNLRPTTEEKRESLKLVIRNHQRKVYAREHQFFIEQGENVQYTQFPENSKILALHPFMDKEGLIRMGNRGKYANIPYDAKHPVIIDRSSRLSELIIHEAHYMTGHGSVQIMCQYIRQNYCIAKLKQALRAYIHKCVTCARFSGKYEQQLMADLPADRVNQNRAFLVTGVDYAGPIQLIERYKSVSSTRKAWIAIFVCMVTRAIHIDVVTEQSSIAFIMCYERFISRRGHCNKLYSDNGTNFKGAFREIKSAFKEWHAPCVQDHINKHGTEWKFMKPVASHQGGIYEAAVKSAKFHLKRMIGKVHYTYEHLMTFLLKIEAILNSRPLYALSDDPQDMQAITPAHFLIGEPFILPPSIAAPKQTSNPMKYMRDEQEKMLNDFWKVWHKEVLATLMQRKKWLVEKEPLKIGQMVVIGEENVAPAKWELAKIIKLIPSEDGIIRAVKVRTPKREIIRPVQKLCILPIEPCPDEQRKKRAINSACEQKKT